MLASSDITYIFETIHKYFKGSLNWWHIDRKMVKMKLIKLWFNGIHKRGKVHELWPIAERE